jgi:NADH:ubiquinone oxidoreductase subunit 2 (subunit N)
MMMDSSIISCAVAVGTRSIKAIRAAIVKYTILFTESSSFYLLGFSIYVYLRGCTACDYGSQAASDHTLVKRAALHQLSQACDYTQELYKPVIR